MIINKFYYEKMNREEIDGSRVYCIPDGSKLPSVTTILDATKSTEKIESLEKWKNRIGQKQAQEIVSAASSRGTRMHSHLEYFIINDDMKKFPTNPFAQPSWYMASKVILEGLCNVDEFWGVEVPLYYSGLYAGTTDCIGVWKGKPAIIDFKQSNKPKKSEWIEDYYLQLVAYALCHNEMHGTDIRTGVVMMCVKPATDDAEPVYQEFVLEEKDFDYWSEKWLARVEQYYSMR